MHDKEKLKSTILNLQTIYFRMDLPKMDQYSEGQASV